MFVPGAQIGKYTLRRKLGQGGFGSVFAAYDESLDREVALKILNAEHKASEDVMRRFLQEARLAARIGHPGIVTVFECALVSGTNTNADGVAYIAMELLDGESLAHRLHRSGRMAPATAMEITRQIASALEAAHAAGIVHRDLKPDNIFLVRDPAVVSGERAKILDFGIAKLHHISSSIQTQTNEVFGTPRYMSPEQCRSSTQIDQRSDIYTLGCILFELLTGRPPFVGQTGELFAQHLMVDPPPVLSLVRDTPYHLADLVARMLAKDVEHRPQTMVDVQRELEAGGAVAVGVPATLPPGISGPMPNTDGDSTLKAAAGMSMMQDSARPSRAVIAAAAGVAIARAIARVVWLRDSGESETKTVASAVEQPAPKVTPIEAPPEAPKANVTPKADDAPTAVRPKADDAPAHAEVEPSKPAAKVDSATKSRRESRREPQVGIKADVKSTPAGAKTDVKSDEPVKPEVVDAKKQADKRIVNPFDAGTGTLALRSSPSCEILVDGKAIAAKTPHELKLSPGKHRITLFNDEHDIRESFQVDIKAGAVERVNKNLDEKIKAKKRNATINPFGGG